MNKIDDYQDLYSSVIENYENKLVPKKSPYIRKHRRRRCYVPFFIYSNIYDKKTFFTKDVPSSKNDEIGDQLIIFLLLDFIYENFFDCYQNGKIYDLAYYRSILCNIVCTSRTIFNFVYYYIFPIVKKVDILLSEINFLKNRDSKNCRLPKITRVVDYSVYQDSNLPWDQSQAKTFETADDYVNVLPEINNFVIYKKSRREKIQYRVNKTVVYKYPYDNYFTSSSFDRYFEENYCQRVIIEDLNDISIYVDGNLRNIILRNPYHGKLYYQYNLSDQSLKILTPIFSKILKNKKILS